MSIVSPCFTPGSLIATERGWRPVEALRRGDKVVTRDNGLRCIAWAGRRDLTYADLSDLPDLRPVLIRKGALGPEAPVRDMLVSPGHRFLVAAAGAPEGEILVAARHLRHLRGVQTTHALGVSYLHLLLEAHEVILADGAWTESFHPDDEMLAGLGPATRSEILALFPEIATHGAARRFPPARAIRQSRFER